MPEFAIPLPDPFDVPVAHLVTEDDTPVDNFFQDKQVRLLVDSLDTSWPEGRPFISACDVGVFATNQESAVVPDMFLSMGVTLPENILEKGNRSYFIWKFGKPPDLVVEIVSNHDGGEDGFKLERYAWIKVPYYVIYDPDHILSQRSLRVRQLVGASYVDKVDAWFPEIGLGLVPSWGMYDGVESLWLRWCHRDGQLLATGREHAQRADAEAQRADTEAQRADAEAQRADVEAQRADAEAQRADAEARRADAEARRARQESEYRMQLEERLRQLGETI